VPRFKAGDFEGGVSAGADAILGAAAGTYAPPEEPPHWKSFFFDRGLWNGVEMILGWLFFVWIAATVEVKSVIEPGGWSLYLGMAPVWALLTWMLLGGMSGVYAAFAHLLAFPILKFIVPRTPWGKELKVTKKAVFYRGSKLYSISSSGGGGGGGSSGGGDWGGGGGDFGGGGSSGSW
jgi:uncharacterized protein